MNDTEIFDLIKDKISEKYVTPFWMDIHKRMSSYLMPIPNNFLDNVDICTTMNSSNKEEAARQLLELEKIYGKEYLEPLVREWEYGNPVIIHDKYYISCNSVHHFYHLHQHFANSTYRGKIKSVIEFGGGYGRLASIINRGYIDVETYTIIDLPFFNTLQYNYLKNVWGSEDRLNIISSKDCQIQEGKVNLLPIGLIDDFVDKLNCDLFIALWSLSEAPELLVDTIINNNFLNSNSQFMAFHGYPDEKMMSGYKLYKYCRENGMKLQPVQIAKNHWYSYN